MSLPLSSYNAFQPRHSHSYRLEVLQQPRKARLCSFKEKVDRRPIDPPPIVQLSCTCHYDACQQAFLYNPYFFLYATLTSDTDDTDINHHHGHSTTAGTVVQSLHKLKDLHQQEGGYFIFADISVRLEGMYRLKFTLFEIVNNNHVKSLVSVLSDPFRVFSPKHFPGMSESTALTKSFSEQGVYIRIRKDTRHAPKRQRTEDQSTRSMSPMVTSSDESSDNARPNRSKSIMSMQNLLSPLTNDQDRPLDRTLPPPLPTSSSKFNVFLPP